MFFHAASENRPYHLGPFPLEEVPRNPRIVAREAARPRVPPGDLEMGVSVAGAFAQAVNCYHQMIAGLADGPVADRQAPVPDDLARRSVDIKGGGYFLNAAHVGICEMPGNAWLQGCETGSDSHAIVILVEWGRVPEHDNLSFNWVCDSVRQTGDMRAAELAVCVAGHVRLMGFAARAHLAGHSQVDLARLAVLSGVALRSDGGKLRNPFLGTEFSIAAVTTNYPLAVDAPLSEMTDGIGQVAYWLGINGAESGRERRRRDKRESHLSRYPMEQLKRVDRPTTLILDDEVPRVPKRAAFFTRALRGDLGQKSQTERGRFATKHPFSQGMIPLIRTMAPMQDGETKNIRPDGLQDPVANAKALKSLSYFLGADLTGICEIPRYAWYSHYDDGRPLQPYHRYAVVMLIDQEYETMEGASGDDWISGAQSMRGYMRGAEIAGIMADTLRDLGISARPQTNTDSDVLHIPLVLWAGLGELSRIGELVLNPFVGPRFKSVVLTTDLPLAVDKPIDFGLQYFCNNCLKCARECPCDAIPFGDKIMFNGYEMWKPDVERCTRYRVTNSKGSACGRCMKTCPLNKVISADGPLLTRMASWAGVNAMWAKPALVPLATYWDDKLGNGKRNLLKKWWFDFEIVDGVCVAAKGSNEREIDPDRTVDPAKQKMAYYPASAMPPPDQLDPVPLLRKAAMAMAAEMESPAEALKRRQSGGAPPKHYQPTPPSGV